jgi:sarcosine oxidase delta subunit
LGEFGKVLNINRVEARNEDETDVAYVRMNRRMGTLSDIWEHFESMNLTHRIKIVPNKVGTDKSKAAESDTVGDF